MTVSRIGRQRVGVKDKSCLPHSRCSRVVHFERSRAMSSSEIQPSRTRSSPVARFCGSSMKKSSESAMKCRGGRGRGFRDESIVPHQSRLRHHELGLDRHQRDRPLVANQGVVIDVPVELVHPPLMAKPLIDGAGLHRDVLVGERQLHHFARAHGERAARRVDGGLQFRPDVLENDAKARRVDHPLALEHQFAEMPQRSVADNKVGIEKQQVGLGHGRPKIGEAAEQRIGQHDTVVAGQVGHQVVERNELGAAEPARRLERGGCRMVSNSLVSVTSTSSTSNIPPKRRQVARREQGWKRHRHQLAERKPRPRAE